jgi:hypothetical protein
MRRILQRLSVRRLFMRRISIGTVLLLCAVAPALYPATALTIAGGMPVEDTLSVKIDGDLSTFSYYDIGFTFDPVLRNLFFSSATFNIWLFRFGIGALLSVIDEGGVKYAPGVSGSIGIEAPGAISLYVEVGMNLLDDLVGGDDTIWNYGKLAAAIWLPHLRPQLIAQKKSLKVGPVVNYNLEDTLVRYQALLDIYFNKASPFFITLGGGYETLNTVIESIPAAPASVRRRETETVSLFATFDASWEIHPDFTLLLNVEVPVSSQGGDTLFKAALGLKIMLSNFYW